MSGAVFVCRDHDAACAEVPVGLRCPACPLGGKLQVADNAQTIVKRAREIAEELRRASPPNTDFADGWQQRYLDRQDERFEKALEMARAEAACPACKGVGPLCAICGEPAGSAIGGVRGTVVPPVPDGVWEALQRLIENAETLGPASKEDAIAVARWRGQFIAARERAAGVAGNSKRTDEMNKQTIYYARFLSPGSFVANDWTRPLESPDPLRVEWPENAYAFSIHKREDVVDGDKRYEGKAEQVGPLYYHPASYVQTLDEAKANPNASAILLDNMRINRWAQIIWTRWGNWPQHFEPGRMAILKAKP